MQYSLRRFVKCTEFCSTCYCKTDAGFEAIKPYVCSKGLCLFQYMQLGMGPSVEWEIRSQPYVVDMLISFAYSRAQSNKLADFPSGLGVKVPGIFDKGPIPATYTGVLDASDTKLQLEGFADVKVGDWILVWDRGADIKSNNKSGLHYRVRDTSCMPLVYLSEPIFLESASQQRQPLQTQRRVHFTTYNMDFDKLGMDAKRQVIVMLLDTLPGVDAMASFSERGPDMGGVRPLGSWVDRISPSALYVLRWIVASNRSCIVYDDDPKHQVSGMQQYLQFRLAQGAPDKEQRFVNSVKAASTSWGLQYPTLFAWHGSPLNNWHSILREGLHFNVVSNGRACGDGVYMSKNFGTSSSYCSKYYTNHHAPWPHSKLNIKTAISLNEVVNAPKTFRNVDPHYVVTDLDWVQPRYLFIQCSGTGLKKGGSKGGPSEICAQDPSYLAHGPDGRPITIPISAQSSRGSRGSQAAKSTNGKASVGKLLGLKNIKGMSTRKTKVPESTTSTCAAGDDDTDSVATLVEDREFLEAESEGNPDESKAKNLQKSASETDFRPGTLQESSLQLFNPPNYATPTATKLLQRCLKETLRVQTREPLHELGWYIDENLINTVYQWTAELHSFDPALPLAKDLKAAGMRSIVVEIRFPEHFPNTPPFVRVVRPRFRPFSMGGGGHVTAGGAMCMELLTSSGWSPASSIESVLLQVRMAISNTEPQPARLDSTRRQQEYSVGEAIDAYKRVSIAHGWRIPDDL
ncbi:ubiquitin conjugating enzyme [Aspergillus sp. HF37]|nr:ubiquitin conjugating enzyme [Aspergillus sp. HF37]